MTLARKRTCDVTEKRRFITKVNYKKIFDFRAGLKEIKYDYVDSKQYFYLQYHVAPTENRHETTLQKRNDTSSSGGPRVYRAWGQTQFKRSQPVRGSIK